MTIFKSTSFYLAIIGICIAIAFTVITGKPPPNPLFAKTPPSAPFDNYIAASGIVEAADKNIEIGTIQSGIVEKLWVKVGDIVKKGDPLFQLDTRDLKAQLLVQQADLQVEKANLEKAKDLVARTKAIRDVRSLSKEEIQNRQDDYEVALAKVNASGAKIEQTQMMIERLTVRAPKDGTILQVNTRVGEFVSQEKSQIILGDLSHLQVRVDIDEQNAGYFKIGDKAVATPKNNPTINISLTFVRVEPYMIPKKSLTGFGEERVDTRVLQVLYSFNPPEAYHVYVGQLVDVFIEKSPN